MGELIVIAVLYVVVFGLFGMLGGLGSAAEGMRSWGRAAGSIRTNPGSSS